MSKECNLPKFTEGEDNVHEQKVSRGQHHPGPGLGAFSMSLEAGGVLMPIYR